MQLSNRAASGDLKAIREVLTAHRIFVEPEPATEAGTDLQQHDETVIKNLQRRLQSFNKAENPEENS